MEETTPSAAERRTTSWAMCLARCEGEWTVNYVALLAASGFHDEIPKRRVEGKPLNLYLMYQAVAKWGGFSRMEKGGPMRHVTEALGHTSSDTQRLTGIYQALLSRFEEFEVRDDNNSLPLAIVANAA